MHGRRSLLRQNIGGDIVYCYPSDDFNGIKNFNGVVIIPGIHHVPQGICLKGVETKTGLQGCNRAIRRFTAVILRDAEKRMIGDPAIADRGSGNISE
jgi:hypothetical protein